MLDQGLRRMNIVMRESKFNSIQSDLSEYQEVFLCLLRHVADGRTTHGPFLHLVVSLQVACYVINTRFSILDFLLQYVAAQQSFIPEAFIRIGNEKPATSP